MYVNVYDVFELFSFKKCALNMFALRTMWCKQLLHDALENKNLDITTMSELLRHFTLSGHFTYIKKSIYK